MENLEQIKRKIGNAEDLRSVVSAMKVLATINMRQYERVAESFSAYSETVEAGVQILLKNKPSKVELIKPLPNNRLLAIVFGSGQGLAGQFNEQIASFAIREMTALGIDPADRTVMAMGEHVALRLKADRQGVDEFHPIPGSLAGIIRLAQDILIRSEEIRSQKNIEQIMLFYQRPVSTYKYQPYRLPLLPLNKKWLDNLAAREWPVKTLPTFFLDWEGLFEALIRQDLYVSLNRAFVESLTSENSSRLISMQAAENNIEDRLDEMTNLFNRVRQGAITSELLDIVAGFEAVMGGAHNFSGASDLA